MSHANLTARYRPQTFADLAGQATIRAILSRAAAEDRVAPAYLFSGTRGVGKTTLARVFAKALNCVNAPAAEPCNICDHCRQITAGTFVDVVEIDGASNRGIDDVRRLKEVVGYAPMDARYKIFIIDEAHMLSREAFNALLKTLEEPPARVTFILATTESHKFPATILSRCQHYVFKRLPEHELEAHLGGVLGREGVPFDEAAIRLIARRAAGSVRDSMSLLGQVLALGGERLTEADTQRVLGLAGQELFFSLFGLLRSGDCLAISKLVMEMLDNGLDLGFFMRELAAVWRALFMLRQAGEAALPALDIPPQDARRWLEESHNFEPAHIHAAWQMTLDGQRRVLTSLEPALALELLLLNLALLPRLLSMEALSSHARRSGAAVSASPEGPVHTAHTGHTGAAQTGPQPTSAAVAPPTVPPQPPRAVQTPPWEPQPNSRGAAAAAMPLAQKKSGESARADAQEALRGEAPASAAAEIALAEAARASALPPEPDTPAHPLAAAFTPAMATDMPEPSAASESGAAPESAVASGPEPDAEPAGFSGEKGGPSTPCEKGERPEAHENTAPRQDRSWEGFLAFCQEGESLPAGVIPLLRQQQAELHDGILRVSPSTEFARGQLEQMVKQNPLAALMSDFYGHQLRIEFGPPRMTRRRPAELRKEMQEHPGVRLLEKHMGARFVDCGESYN